MNEFKGIILTILSAVAFGFTPILVNMTYQLKVNTSMISFFRVFLVLPVLWFSLKSRNVHMSITKKEFIRLLILTIFGQALTMFILYDSYQYIDIGVATTLHFIYPVIVTIVGIVFFKERYNYLKIIALIISTCGMILLLQRTGENIHLKGIILASLSGVTYAFYIVFLDVSNLKNMDSIKVTFYNCAISSFIFLITSNIKGEFTLKFSWVAYILLFIISVVTAIVGTSFLQEGIRHIGASTASILSTFEPITSVVFGYLVFHEILSLRKIIACVLIFSSVVLLSLGTKIEERKSNKAFRSN